MSDLQFSPGLDEPGAFPQFREKPRRFARIRQTRAIAPRGQVPITEGAALQPVHVREGAYRRALATADAAAALIALCVVVIGAAGARPEAWMLLAAPLAILVSKVGGLYERDELVLRKTTLDETPALLQITGLFALIVFMGQNMFVHAQMTPSLVFELWMASFAAIVAGRVCARRVARRLTAPERCLVVGDADAIRTVHSKLGGADVNAKVVASVHIDPFSKLDGDRFRSLVARNEVHRVILAPVTTDACDTLDLVRVAKSVGVRVSLLPRLLEVVGSSVEFDQIDGLTMLGVRQFGLSRSSRALKRAFDLVVSGTMLLAVGPLMALVAAAVRLDSKGPVLFRQTRVGRDGEHFDIFKFRTMVPDAESRKTGLAHLNETQGLFKITNDPRITRVGSFLRRTALDELPQLLNVWRGEMSLVGPRPLVIDEDAKIEGLDRSRLHLTPGMTGHWQILGSGRVPLHEMVGIDYLYVANWSLWTDLKIMLRTVPYMLARRGA